MSITGNSTVGKLAAEHPLATRVFARHSIDFCCGGGEALHNICREKGLDLEAVLAEIRSETEPSQSTPQRWDHASLKDLIEHILVTHHQPLREELPRLESMARKVVRVHGSKDPERLPELLEVYLSLKSELEQHMMKEERILFPMIMQGHGSQTGGPISVMEQEHESAGTALRRLRELTDDYQPPVHACNTWKALWHGLGALEQDMHQHIHLENNILFPRAAAS